MPNPHSILPPSSAARRMACPGSRALEASIEETEISEAAQEGTKAHAVASFVLEALRNGNIDEIQYPGPEDGITEEMWDGAKLYAADVKKIRSDKTSDLLIEQTLNLRAIHPEAYGTPDCVFVNEETKTLYIWDYKFGHGYVEVFQNAQLLSYAAAFFEYFKSGSIEHVNLRIVQPRYYGPEGKVREWELPVERMLQAIDQLASNANDSLAPDAPCFTNRYCNTCKARSVCPTLQKLTLTLIDVAHDNTPHINDTQAIASEVTYLRDAIKRLEARLTGLEEQAIHLIKSGQSIPGYALQPTATREVWTATTEELKSMQQLYGIMLYKPPQLITPNQARDKGLPKGIVDKFSKRPPGELKLQAVNFKKIFGTHTLV